VEERALCASVSNRWLANIEIKEPVQELARSSTGRWLPFAAANKLVSGFWVVSNRTAEN